METKDLINQAINLLEVALAQIDKAVIPAQPSTGITPPAGSPAANVDPLVLGMLTAGHENDPAPQPIPSAIGIDHNSDKYDVANPGSYRTFHVTSGSQSKTIDIPGPGVLNIAGGEAPGNKVATYRIAVSSPNSYLSLPANTSQANADFPVSQGTYTITVLSPDGECVVNLRAEYKPA